MNPTILLGSEQAVFYLSEGQRVSTEGGVRYIHDEGRRISCFKTDAQLVLNGRTV
jgi:hypothetical protein